MSQFAEPDSSVKRELPQENDPHSCKVDSIDPLEAWKVVRAAMRGDPEALRTVLSQLVPFLRKESDLPREYAAFISDAVEAFVNSKAMKTAGKSYREHQRNAVDRKLSEITEEEKAKDDADRITDEQLNARIQMRMWFEILNGTVCAYLPERPKRSGLKEWTGEATRDSIGRAFCAAFKIAPPKSPKKPLYTDIARLFQRSTESYSRAMKMPTSIDKAFYVEKVCLLLLYGESQGHAIEIVRSAVKDPKSKSQIIRYLKEEDAAGKIDSQESNRHKINLGFLVEACVIEGSSLEDALSTVAERVVQNAAGLPHATIFLKESTVKAAYALSKKFSSQ